MKRCRNLCICMLLFFTQSMFAYSQYYSESPTGWHWNNVPEKPILKKPKKSKMTKNNNDNNPIKEMQRMHELIAYYKDKAILNPTVSNIRNYLIVQNSVMQQSSLFAKNWRKVMLLYPEFDYGISHPTDSRISQIAESNLHQNQVAVVKLMAKQDGLLFFYDGKNPLSAQMEQTVSQFASFYHFSVIAVSMDGIVIPAGFNTEINHGQAQALGIKALPALVLVDPENGAHFILSYGYASINALLADCFAVAKDNVN